MGNRSANATILGYLYQFDFIFNKKNSNHDAFIFWS